jgi:DNA polymerase-3 subunit epsilon/ATP-dependent DNA helicase DinG
MVNRPPDRALRDGPLIALAVLSSGPIPWRDRLLAIAALKFQERRVLGRFTTLLRPRRRVPEYARRALAAAEGDWDQAPRFDDVEARLRDSWP